MPVGIRVPVPKRGGPMPDKNRYNRKKKHKRGEDDSTQQPENYMPGLQEV